MANPPRAEASHAFEPATKPPLKREVDDDCSVTSPTVHKRQRPVTPAEHAAQLNKEALKAIYKSIPEDQRNKQMYNDFTSLASAVKFLQEHGIQMKDDGWLLEGMNLPLKPYQVVAVAWGVRLMQTGARTAGGILGDVMGLGKTIEALGILLVTQWSMRKVLKLSQGTSPQRHLVVVPKSLCKQWLKETHKMTQTFPEWPPGISDKRKASLASLGFSGVGSYDELRKAPIQHIKNMVLQYDLIVATYDEVRFSFPRMRPDLKSDEDIAEWMADSMSRAGPLHQIKWLTVVFDEADRIRNPRSAVSCACQALQSKYKLPMSGTLTVNGVADLWVPLKLIDRPGLPSYEEFQEEVSLEDKEEDEIEASIDYVRRMIEPCLLRRTVQDNFLGQKLLNIPASLPSLVVFLDLNQIERKVYDVLYGTYKKRVRRAKRIIDKEERKRYVLAMTTPMRLAADHILLLKDSLTNKLDLGSLSKLLDGVASVSDKDGMDIMVQLALMFQQTPTDCAYGDGYLQICQSNISKTTIEQQRKQGFKHLIGGMHGACKLDYTDYLNDLRRGHCYNQITIQTSCVVCKLPPERAVVADCDCIYCKDCFQDLREHSELLDQDIECQECGERIQEVKDCVKRLAEDRRSRSDADWASKFGKKCKPSAKTSATVALCKKWLTDSSIKILIFSHFVSMLDVLGWALETNKIKHAKFHGAMNTRERDKVVEQFKVGGDISVLLMSTKAGAVGLNLTNACKVIIIDPWWNEAVEQQAFGRVFRHGQMKTTEIVRFVTRDTIEEYMMEKKLQKLRNLTMVAGLGIPTVNSSEAQDAMDYFDVSKDEEELSDEEDLADGGELADGADLAVAEALADIEPLGEGGLNDDIKSEDSDEWLRNW